MRWAEFALALVFGALFTAFYFLPRSWFQPAPVRPRAGVLVVVATMFYLYFVDDERRPMAGMHAAHACWFCCGCYRCCNLKRLRRVIRTSCACWCDAWVCWFSVAEACFTLSPNLVLTSLPAAAILCR